MSPADRISVAKRYLRRKYANDLEGLKTLAETVAGSAFSTVTITGNAFEGGSANGQITFEPLEYLGAVEDLIAELDPEAPAQASSVIHTDYSCRPVET